MGSQSDGGSVIEVWPARHGIAGDSTRVWIVPAWTTTCCFATFSRLVDSERDDRANPVADMDRVPGSRAGPA
jgi:hypothetical protein